MDYEKHEGELSTEFLENILLSTSPYSDGSPDPMSQSISDSNQGSPNSIKELDIKDFDDTFVYTPDSPRILN